MNLLAIGIFGMLGVFTRYFLGKGINKWAPPLDNNFPLATLITNLLGALLIGVAYVILVERYPSISVSLKNGILVGFLGGLTTFSTFSLDALLLLQGRNYLFAGLYFIVGPLTALLFTFLSMTLTRKFL